MYLCSLSLKIKPLNLTVVVSCVCVCLYVCLSAYAILAYAILAVRVIKSITKDTIVLSVRFAAKLKWRFS